MLGENARIAVIPPWARCLGRAVRRGRERADRGHSTLGENGRIWAPPFSKLDIHDGRPGDPGAPWKKRRAGDPGRHEVKGTESMATDIAQGADGSGAETGAADAHLTVEDRVWLLRAMRMMRGMEERAMTLYRQGKVPGSFYDG